MSPIVLSLLHSPQAKNTVTGGASPKSPKQLPVGSPWLLACVGLLLIVAVIAAWQWCAFNTRLPKSDEAMHFSNTIRLLEGLWLNPDHRSTYPPFGYYIFALGTGGCPTPFFIWIPQSLVLAVAVTAMWISGHFLAGRWGAFLAAAGMLASPLVIAAMRTGNIDFPFLALVACIFTSLLYSRGLTEGNFCALAGLFCGWAAICKIGTFLFIPSTILLYIITCKLQRLSAPGESLNSPAQANGQLTNVWTSLKGLMYLCLAGLCCCGPWYWRNPGVIERVLLEPLEKVRRVPVGEYTPWLKIHPAELNYDLWGWLWGWPLSLVFLTAAAIGLWVIAKQARPYFFFFLGAFIAPLLLLQYLCYNQTHYVLPQIVPGLLLVALVFGPLMEKRLRRRGQLVSVAILVSLALTVSLYPFVGEYWPTLNSGQTFRLENGFRIPNQHEAFLPTWRAVLGCPLSRDNPNEVADMLEEVYRVFPLQPDGSRYQHLHPERHPYLVLHTAMPEEMSFAAINNEVIKAGLSHMGMAYYRPGLGMDMKDCRFFLGVPGFVVPGKGWRLIDRRQFDEGEVLLWELFQENDPKANDYPDKDERAVLGPAPASVQEEKFEDEIIYD